jgi:hypothetical protein
MRLRMSKILRFWVDYDYGRRKRECIGWTKTRLLVDILREYEEAGDAMRYLNAQGQVAWKATPRMLRRLVDAEQEARDDAELDS